MLTRDPFWAAVEETRRRAFATTLERLSTVDLRVLLEDTITDDQRVAIERELVRRTS